MHHRNELLNTHRHIENDDHYRASNPQRYMNEQITFESHFPDTSKNTMIMLQQPENTRNSKQTEKGGKSLWINLVFKDSWNLQWYGKYTDDVMSTFGLEKNASSKEYEFSETAEMYFGSVHDDNNHPFLRLHFECATTETGSFSPIEIIAKRIDNSGPGDLGKRDLSKNEKLRLGFPMRADGTFVTELRKLRDGTAPIEAAESEGSFDSLKQELDEQAQVYHKIHDKLKKKWKEFGRALDLVDATIPSAATTRAPRRTQSTTNDNNNNSNNNNKNNKDDDHTTTNGNGTSSVGGENLLSPSRTWRAMPNHSSAPRPSSRQEHTPMESNDEPAAPTSAPRTRKRPRPASGTLQN